MSGVFDLQNARATVGIDDQRRKHVVPQAELVDDLRIRRPDPDPLVGVDIVHVRRFLHTIVLCKVSVWECPTLATRWRTPVPVYM